MSLLNTDKNMVGEISKTQAQTSPPPKIPATMPIKVSRGMDMSMAMTRGNTKMTMGSNPWARRASISSLAFIEPIWAVNALAVRPAMRMAVNSTANSRKKEKPTRSTVEMVAPKVTKMVAPKKATTAPTKKVSKAMMGTAFRPTSSIWATTEVKRQLRTMKILRAQVVRMRPTKLAKSKKWCQKRSVATPMRTSRLLSQL